MAEPFANLFRSKIVNFQVGPEGTNFTVHAQPLASLSQALNALINGDMVEARTGVIDWRDMDEETFLRFCEFAYVQDYTPPRFSECTDNREVPKQVEKKKQKINSGWPGNTREDESKRSIKSRLRNLLSESDYPLPSSNQSFRQQFQPVSNTSPHQELAPVFLGHARLYVLADKYDVRELKNLVLHKFCNALKLFTLWESRIAEVVELVRFVYDNTPPSYQHEAGAASQSEANTDRPVNISGGSSSNGQGSNHKEKKWDGLRKLVTCLVVSKLEMVAETRVFLDLLHDGGEFVKDFWAVLLAN
ncbi:hypothetical protein V8E54_004114 [Elaphomyces granulatus]|jgi:hypothetical protein